MPISQIVQLLRRLCIWLFWPALAIVVWGELRPGAHNDEAVVWDKILHFTAYFGLAAMATFALRARRTALWIVLGLIGFGGLLEILQGLVGRDADILDEVANSVGALTGGIVGWAIWYLRGKLVAASPPP